MNPKEMRDHVYFLLDTTGFQTLKALEQYMELCYHAIEETKYQVCIHHAPICESEYPAKIQLIKYLRELTGCGLKEGKDFCDQISYTSGTVTLVDPNFLEGKPLFFDKDRAQEIASYISSFRGYTATILIK